MFTSMLDGMSTEPMTTIKVTKQLRERVSRSAARAGLTAAGFITDLIDEHDRQDRFNAVRRAYETNEVTYAGETAEWDSLAGDGLDS